MLLETRAIVLARVRAALVRVMEQARLRASSFQGHVQRAERQVPIVDRAQRPADHESRVEVEDRREIELAARANDELLVPPTHR
jgi:hypothetical protein